MPDKHSEIATLIGSRICHDLISPLGAISNGLELLELSGQPKSLEMDLINESVKTANAKLRLLRLAFGAPDPDAQISAQEIKNTLRDNYSDPRLFVSADFDSPIRKDDAKLIFLLLLCFEKIAPYGGEISITLIDHGFQIDVVSKDVKLDGFIDIEASKILHKDGASFIQFVLINTELQRRSLHLKLDQTQDKLTCRVTLP